MSGYHHAQVITALGDVPSDKIDRVYGQVQRLMPETAGQIQLREARAVESFIQHLQNCDTDARAMAFTNDLVTRVNAAQTLDDNALFTHIQTAWDRVRGRSNNELLDLARQIQSTHKKEGGCHLTFKKLGCWNVRKAL